MKLTEKELQRVDESGLVVVTRPFEGRHRASLVQVRGGSVEVLSEQDAEEGGVADACRELLRWHDKTGGDSRYAGSARRRLGKKRR